MTNDELLKAVSKKLNVPVLRLELDWWIALNRGEFNGDFWEYLAFVGK